MTTGGLTPTGFIAPTVEELVTDLNASILADIDAGLDLSPDQPMGQLVAIFAEKLAEVWEVGATVYNAMNPDAAEGQLLDNVCALSGTRRRSATYSKVTATLNLNGGASVSAGSVASVLNQPTNRWVLLANTTNGTGMAMGIDAEWRSEQPGPFVANANTLTVIETPTVGWNSITNAADAVVGIPEDTDPVLRLERVNELSAPGSGTVDAIRARILEVAGVIQCFVFENTTMVTDANGVPAKSYRVVFWDGPGMSASNTAIAQAIWDSKPAGISTYGLSSALAVDSTGKNRTVFFDRAQEVPIYVALTATQSQAISGQVQGIKDALVAYGVKTFNLDVDVIALALRAQGLTVPGIADIPTFTLGTAPAPVGTGNIPISGLQIATLSSTNISVVI